MTTEKPIISTKHGQLRGVRLKSVYDDVYFSFEAVPYAKPPLGQLRFKAPVTLDPWDGILECNNSAEKSVQLNRKTEQVDGNEDCLYLNLYTKRLESEKRLPVMVYLHGGAFSNGDASRQSLGPDYFMMKDIVLITVGFRIGALGFASFTDPTVNVPGNAGLKDQVLALKWIQENIEQFNGDSQNITLFGHSSGSASVHLLMLSDQCKGLFHKAILMAGFAWPIATVFNIEYRIARSLGYNGPDNDQAIYEFLKEVPAQKLVGFNDLSYVENRRGYLYPIGPCVEKFVSDGAIITINAMEQARRAWSNNIPIMLGATSQEGLLQHELYSSAQFYQLHKEHPEFILPMELSAELSEENQREFAKDIIRFHFGEKEFSEENVAEMTELFSMVFVHHKLNRTLTSRLSHSMAPTYLFRFDFESPKVRSPGPSHGDELAYLFHGAQQLTFDRNSLEFKTMQRLIDMWTAFAFRSDPNAQSTKPAVWKPVERFGPRKCLNIAQDMTFLEWPEAKKCSFWDEMYTKAGVQLS